ncbi:MAG: hypothetical protein F4X54_06715 [Chloroflexi bacterium]|nr:hypothetical protein [Chloroflexota bacterium]MYB84409.1 hypothetical protein [Chloroflexota bacterium]
MLNDLVTTINGLRDQIATYRPELSKNEYRTRTVLIDPLLKALGWDVTDPGSVTVEYEVGNGRADYGLRRGLEHPPVMVVEAKHLDKNLAPDIGQLLGYATERGVVWSCITDGNIWEVYRSFEMNVPVEERLKLRVTITEGDSTTVALALLGLWQQSLRGTGNLQQASQPLMDADQPPPPEQGWTPLSGEFNATGMVPTAVRFQDGEKHIHTWRGFVIETLGWLHRAGVPLSEFKRSQGRYLFSLSGKHPTGRDFRHPIPLPAIGVVIEANISAKEAVRQTRRLLVHVGKDPALVSLTMKQASWAQQ